MDFKEWPTISLGPNGVTSLPSHYYRGSVRDGWWYRSVDYWPNLVEL